MGIQKNSTGGRKRLRMSATEEGWQQWHLRRGQYLGEVSAICFLHLPSHISSLPLLLAGTGSQVLVYDIATGSTIGCFQVFDGIRVHGVTLEEFCQHSSDKEISFKVAVYGERRVKLYNLCIHAAVSSQSCCELELTLVHSLPKFSHWILDVCFFKNCFNSSSTQGSSSLTVGCSDNSVCFWDMLSCKIVSRVKSADRCLLYSMRMWNSKVDSLYVASGTIYNEIVIWKVNFQYHSPVVSGPKKDSGNDSVDVGSCDQQYHAAQVCRLIGHEGSIFRMAWSSDGLKLLSVSDDRSARIWTVGDRLAGLHNPEDAVSHFVGPVLFGHCARVWDCCMSDNIIITAGEDCTCRVWGLDGAQLKVIKEHIGRGVWRCLYDPISSLLVTAGFDSAIKVHHLHMSSSKNTKGCINAQEDMNNRAEVFTVHIPNSSGHIGLMDSKSEYVRCLWFSCEDSLYVATNNGYLYHALLSGNGEVKWTELVQIGERAPIVCMDLLTDSSDHSAGIQHWIAVGDGKGNATVVQVVGDIWSPKVAFIVTWSAEIERQLLGIYMCKSLGYRFIFTADPRGALKLWKLCDPSAFISHGGERSYNACLMAEYVSCFGLRIMCLDASFEEEVLVCGDICGNILLFPLLWSSSAGLEVASHTIVTPLNYFKGAHGISSVCSISIVNSSSSQVEICSTGQDGCICHLEHDRDRQSLEFIGMKVVKELSALQSIVCNGSYDDDMENCQYAIGFASSDFVIWNLTAETEVVKVSCGGWRRPHSYYVGNVPEIRYCFGFVKNDAIHIHRHWLHDGEQKIYPQNLHLQFHGREIHSICFIITDFECNSNGNHGSSSKSCWIATGCEDGTVRLTRYEPCSKNWSTSKLLGEHVGGSAVRSICCVSKMYTVLLDHSDGMHGLKEDLKDLENPFLLISVGAKKVVTAWKRKLKMTNKRETFNGDQGIRVENRCHVSSPCESFPSISFQWLSSDMPMKIRCQEKQQSTQKGAEAGSGGSHFAGNWNMTLKQYLTDECENDWRYLAVTAFLVRVAGSRVSVCFVVVACSDATVTLRALLLPCHLWFDVAVLTPLVSPVLAMKHIIISHNVPFVENLSVGNLYIVVTGSTDGSLAFWDLTKVVGNFMQQISSLKLKDYFDCQKRPRTGRGSQGGRRWRSLGFDILKRESADEHKSGSHFKNGEQDNASFSITHGEKSGKELQNCILQQPSEILESEQNADAGGNQTKSRALVVSEEAADTTSFGICEIEPFHILNNVHQSGVNCLYVSEIREPSISAGRSSHYILSGGDDQALNCLRVDITWKAGSCNYQEPAKDGCDIPSLESMNNYVHIYQIQNYCLSFISLDKVTSAHASAVKGVWTDGNWVFSTGLDQRVRCWILGWHGKLTEHGHLVTSVPEPEALEAVACGRNEYQIAVAGRGLQMVEFCASSSHGHSMEN